jgi:hypothetical protein
MSRSIEPDDVGNRQTPSKVGRESPRTQIQKLLWLSAGLIILILIALLSTNVILFRRVGELKAELVEMKAEQLKFQKGMSK